MIIYVLIMMIYNFVYTVATNIFLIALVMITTQSVIVFSILVVKKQLKRKKNIIMLLILGVVIILVYSGNVWYTSPMAGYTEQYIRSGGETYRPKDIVDSKYFSEYPQYSGPVMGLTGNPTQQDVDFQIKLLDKLGYGILDVSAEVQKNRKLNYSKFDGNINVAYDYYDEKNSSEIYVAPFSNRNHVGIRLQKSDSLSFEKTKNINHLDLSYGSIVDLERIEFEGIENIEKITFYDQVGNDCVYYPKYRLKEFLHDWGWLDEDGYYGKIYPKSEKDELYKKGIHMCGSVECDIETNGDRGIPPEEYEEEK